MAFEAIQREQSPFWKVLLFSIGLIFILIVLEFWVFEIAIMQGLKPVLLNYISTYSTIEAGDQAVIQSAYNHITTITRSLLFILITALIAYNIIYVFRKERV